MSSALKRFLLFSLFTVPIVSLTIVVVLLLWEQLVADFSL